MSRSSREHETRFPALKCIDVCEPAQCPGSFRANFTLPARGLPLMVRHNPDNSKRTIPMPQSLNRSPYGNKSAMRCHY